MPTLRDKIASLEATLRESITALEALSTRPNTLPVLQDALSLLLQSWQEFAFLRPLAEVLIRESNPIGLHLRDGSKFLKLAIDRLTAELNGPTTS